MSIFQKKRLGISEINIKKPHTGKKMSGSPRGSTGNVRSDMDIAYPEPLSRLHRHSLLAEYPKLYKTQKKNARNRRGNRYRTQPVTFDEIQEVDEESVDENQLLEKDKQKSSALSTSELQHDFFRFSKSIDKTVNKILKKSNEQNTEKSNEQNTEKSNEQNIEKTNEENSEDVEDVEEQQQSPLRANSQREPNLWSNKPRQGSI